ncbi:MAG: T9SS type A sorting domain-containing protein, partial [Chitinivibrionales bacterium]|nr:T9SS type A sorting domain-containing protein [Chitinivibrionales bacterium]
EQYWVSYLYQYGIYGFSCYRLDFANSKVVSIASDYVEDDPTDRDYVGTCPDPEVQVLLAHLVQSGLEGARVHTEKARNYLQAANIKVVMLVHSQETKTAVKNYLACPKLKVWGRIGHGSTSAIQLCGGGSWTSSDNSACKEQLKGKAVVFNSCQCHNSPFEPSMTGTGVMFYAAGDINLSGGKEGVFSDWVKLACVDKKGCDVAMNEAISKNSYPNAWGQSGNGAKPWLIDFGGNTSIINNMIINKDFSFVVNHNTIIFNNASSKIAIYNLAGQLINQISPEKTGVVSLNNQTAGTYMAVMNSGTATISKSFTIVK